jgi:drug/metabolite transporter (DMT)-like permease
MQTEALLAVLVGAILHAGWNTAVKSGSDKRFDTTLVAGGAAAIATLLLPWLDTPSTASLPYLASSVALQLLYFRLVAAAYQTGDMSHAYPLMRGTPPLLVAAASGVLLGETLSPTAWAGTLLVCGGVLTLSLARGSAGVSRSATVFSLGNAVVIAAYTLVDGVGVRLSGSASAYTLWVFLLSGLPLVAGTLWRQPQAFRRYVAMRWPVGLGGGICILTSYGLALWAMTRAPVATVAALRESSILFGMLFAALFLKESIRWTRALSGLVIALGAAVVRL